ncbi:MAG: EAL domain-containing protein [Actinomycetota bacterium]|nr:EAL domain-containing protein [Actinomycetota bacterium]
MNQTRTGTVSDEDLAAFVSIVGDRRIQAQYQPIVDLDSRAVIGWEALARGPQGSALEFPDRLFGVARQLGRTSELDFACQAAAIEGALAAGLGDNADLFINIEPRNDPAEVPEYLLETYRRALGQLRITVEIRERELAARPADLVAAADQLRALPGWGIALDDVGVDPRSVGLIPLVEPDVIKLDMSFLHEPMSRTKARAAHAVFAEAERTGAKVLAEGIEDEQQLQYAIALGAQLGQGWFFGRPGELHPEVAVTGGTRRRNRADASDRPPSATTPYEILSRRRTPRRGTKPMLLQMSLALEDEALVQGEGGVLISTFQDARFFGEKTATRYSRISDQIAFTGVLAEGLGDDPAPGVRGAGIDRTMKLRSEWDVVMLAPHFAAAFAARELEPDTVSSSRRFDYVITYDRDLVSLVANQLMRQIAPLVET